MGCQAGHSEPRSPAGPEPCPGVKEGLEAPLLTVWSLCLGAGWLPGPNPGWRPRLDTGVDLRRGPAQLVPKLPRRGQHEGRGPPGPGVRPSGLHSWGWDQLLLCTCTSWWQPSVTVVRVDESSACKRV